MCVVGAQQIEPRQRFHVQCNDQSLTVDRSVKVYAQLARERVVVTQGDDAELSIILSGRRD